MDKYVLILGVCRNLDGMPLCGNALLWEIPNVKGQECGGMSLCIFAVSITFQKSYRNANNGHFAGLEKTLEGVCSPFRSPNGGSSLISQADGANLFCDKIIAEYCMKLNEIGLRGGARS